MKNRSSLVKCIGVGILGFGLGFSATQGAVYADKYGNKAAEICNFLSLSVPEEKSKFFTWLTSNLLEISRNNEKNIENFDDLVSIIDFEIFALKKEKCSDKKHIELSLSEASGLRNNFIGVLLQNLSPEELGGKLAKLKTENEGANKKISEYTSSPESFSNIFKIFLRNVENNLMRFVELKLLSEKQVSSLFDQEIAKQEPKDMESLYENLFAFFKLYVEKFESIMRNHVLPKLSILYNETINDGNKYLLNNSKFTINGADFYYAREDLLDSFKCIKESKDDFVKLLDSVRVFFKNLRLIREKIEEIKQNDLIAVKFIEEVSNNI